MGTKGLKGIPAIILAGGLGTRLQGLKEDLPKPLIKVGGRSLLERNIRYLKEAGVREFILSIGYKGDLIRDHFGGGEDCGVKIAYAEDPYPLGDAGAFKYAYGKLGGRVILADADELREGLDLGEMLGFHVKKKALVTMSVVEQEDVENHAIMELDGDLRATRLMMNPSPEETSSRYANAGLYIMEEAALNYFPDGHCMMKDVFRDIVSSGGMYCFPFDGAYFNVGTREILEKANEYFGSP
jgi:mannose-1-phosphate guanylyltransferase